MPIEIDVRIIGQSTQEVVQELGAFASYLSAGLGVSTPQANTADATSQVTTGNGAAEPDKPPTTRKRAPAAAKPDPAPEPEKKAALDRAAIIDGLTKIYSKGDEDVRLAITKFRDGQGADRLRDLKDEDLPAAAALLTELKLADQPAV